MQKNFIVLAALSLLVLTMLPVHNIVNIHLVGKTDWLNMAFALPIGLAIVLKFDLITNKNNRKQ